VYIKRIVVLCPFGDLFVAHKAGYIVWVISAWVKVEAGLCEVVWGGLPGLWVRPFEPFAAFLLHKRVEPILEHLHAEGERELSL
jgi:hypothetical protein